MGAMQDRLDDITRHAGTTHFWQIPGMPVQFDHRGKTYNGIVKAWTDISRCESNVDLAEIEVEETTTHTWTDWNNQQHTTTQTKRYVWPEPIQSYKLRKRVG